jgi:hypothetical protein
MRLGARPCRKLPFQQRLTWSCSWSAPRHFGSVTSSRSFDSRNGVNPTPPSRAIRHRMAVQPPTPVKESHPLLATSAELSTGETDLRTPPEFIYSLVPSAENTRGRVGRDHEAWCVSSLDESSFRTMAPSTCFRVRLA